MSPHLKKTSVLYIDPLKKSKCSKREKKNLMGKYLTLHSGKYLIPNHVKNNFNKFFLPRSTLTVLSVLNAMKREKLRQYYSD